MIHRRTNTPSSYQSWSKRTVLFMPA